MTIPGIYSQRDGRWSNLELGFNTDPYFNLYHYGCAITAVANVILDVTGDWSWTPAHVNQWLKDNGGYAPGGGLIIWGALANLMASFGIEYHGYSSNLDAVNTWLAPDNAFAIAQLTKTGFPMHFSAMPYVGQIADSWDAKLKPVTSYSFVGAHLYSKTVPQTVVAVPPTEPAPVQAVVAPPTVPVASTETPVENPHPETETTPAPDPSVPEYQATWQHWDTDRDMTIVREGAYAFDAETGTKVTDIANGDTRTYAGSFTTGGVQMVRTRFSANSAKWIGVPASFFTLDGNYVNAPLPVKQMSEEEHTKLTQTFVADVQQTATIWRKLLELLFEHIAKKLNKGKV